MKIWKDMTAFWGACLFCAIGGKSTWRSDGRTTQYLVGCYRIGTSTSYWISCFVLVQSGVVRLSSPWRSAFARCRSFSRTPWIGWRRNNFDNNNHANNKPYEKSVHFLFQNTWIFQAAGTENGWIGKTAWFSSTANIGHPFRWNHPATMESFGAFDCTGTVWLWRWRRNVGYNCAAGVSLVDAELVGYPRPEWSEWSIAVPGWMMSEWYWVVFLFDSHFLNSFRILFIHRSWRMLSVRLFHPLQIMNLGSSRKTEKHTYLSMLHLTESPMTR